MLFPGKDCRYFDLAVLRYGIYANFHPGPSITASMPPAAQAVFVDPAGEPLRGDLRPAPCPELAYRRAHTYKWDCPENQNRVSWPRFDADVYKKHFGAWGSAERLREVYRQEIGRWFSLDAKERDMHRVALLEGFRGAEALSDALGYVGVAGATAWLVGPPALRRPSLALLAVACGLGLINDRHAERLNLAAHAEHVLLYGPIAARIADGGTHRA